MACLDVTKYNTRSFNLKATSQRLKQTWLSVWLFNDAIYQEQHRQGLLRVPEINIKANVPAKRIYF